MADITAAPDNVYLVGGATLSGPALGIYHVKVTEAALGASKKKGTPQIELQLNVDDDPNHPAKQGKKLAKLTLYFPKSTDDKEHKQKMGGIMKRMLYEGFNVPWPKEEGKKLDPRIFIGKTAWVRLGEEVDANDPEKKYGKVTHVAQDRTKLPQDQPGAANGEAPKARSSTRR